MSAPDHDSSSSPVLITPALLREVPLPEPGSSKSDRGDVLVIGGARRTPGAAALTGMAALRVGAGRLTLAVAESVAAGLAASFFEAGVVGLEETPRGSVRGTGLGPLREEIEGADCIVIGPGLDDADGTLVLLENIAPLLPDGVTLVLDAFALGVLPKASAMRAAAAGRVVLTPNGAEAQRLLDRESGETLDDARAIAERYQAVVGMKSFVVEPDGAAWEVSTGHPGLGTSGSGDVLAGAIAGLLARGASAGDAARWASYLHAAAGDRLISRIGPLGYLAGELTEELPVVLRELS
ncbi:NAD(P)H-hydrate dehydratase [Naasia lichenicola]|uniref:ADP-dependent (S)-NAD(P)H-hydrate dehydratase n=1 Tax=Naasia lichenicola TaxID=2565933 RepID=A0A4S4FR89_9MICO|nr:NAD(P)H-hydrate dehydratase [Naasia lichenicola]THG33143.1 NAD(P)H-hydrate dehydratase [Naasia lichenicola]